MICGMRVIDAHVHFIDLNRPEGVVWPSSDNPCCRNFMPADLGAEAGNTELDGCVLIETSSRPSDNEWMLQLCEQEPLILGVVANLNPESEHFSDRLQRLIPRKGFAGLRLRPIEQFDLQSSCLRENLQQLGVHGKTIELGATSFDRLHQFAQLACAIPNTICILDHFGHPSIDGFEPDPTWLDALKAFAANDNAVCKVSGLMSFAMEQPAPRELEYYQSVLGALYEAFGQERLMYGSNWPPARSAGSYLASFNLLKKFFEAMNDSAVEKFFSANACQIYRL